jgi:hypothetical protein
MKVRINHFHRESRCSRNQKKWGPKKSRFHQTNSCDLPLPRYTVHRTITLGTRCSRGAKLKVEKNESRCEKAIPDFANLVFYLSFFKFVIFYSRLHIYIFFSFLLLAASMNIIVLLAISSDVS